MITDIALTGTRHGMSTLQLDAVKLILSDYKNLGAEVFRHGDCPGADVEAAAIAQKLGYDIIIHPGPSGVGSKANLRHSVLPFLERNRAMVNATQYLLVAPFKNLQIMRSGTWATFRYALKIGCPYTILSR